MKLVDDETIYNDMGRITEHDAECVESLLLHWAGVLDEMPEDINTTRIVFLTCVQTIVTAGPAYCKIAAGMLMREYAKTGI
jgi:hypothetical protein